MDVSFKKPPVAQVDLPKDMQISQFKKGPLNLLEYLDCVVAQTAGRVLAHCFLRIAHIPQYKVRSYIHWEESCTLAEKIAVLRAVIQWFGSSQPTLMVTAQLFASELSSVEQALSVQVDASVNADMREHAADRMQIAFLRINYKQVLAHRK